MESAAQSIAIVSKLGQLLVDEVQDIRGVGDKMVLLMDELSTMNAALRVISEADQSAVDHLMREWEKQVRELAYDAEDCADIYHLRIHRPIPLLPYIVKWPKYQLEKLLLQRTLAADVKALVARATAVGERRARYGIDRALLPTAPWFAPVSGASVSATSALRRADDDHHQFVGIREQATPLAERIKELRVEDDKRLKVFSIVGFGGLGKTTLAVELCRLLDADFQRQALVSVSQAFDAGQDMKGLLARLIVKVKEDESSKKKVTDEGHEQEQTNEAVGTAQGNQREIDKMDVEDLSRHLEEQLKEKRYLIVIDDVWSQPAWKAIRIRLPENNCGSRVIVTTRIETVASSVSDGLVHHMEPLKLEDSKTLFIKRVFGSTSDSGACPGGLKDFMDKILKKCSGLPLAIVSIASLLANYNSAESEKMWETVSKSIGSQMEGHPTLEGMWQVITLSYDYLPHHLKACMMYLSIFPEDYVIAKDRLLYRWIAEGLVAEKRGLTLFDVAEGYFHELISRNMIQPDKLLVTRSFFPAEMVEACRVHDMMLEVMVFKSQDANFVSLVGRQYGGLPRGKIRRLSVHGSDDKHGSNKNLQHVRSLNIFQLESLNKLWLGAFKLLRVLDLEDCYALQNKHMRYVCRLYLLRFLRLTGIQITKVPREISDLEYLESLEVESRMLYTMPPSMTKLLRLERVRVNKWILPQGLGNMKALREVDFGKLECDIQVAGEIGELQQLQVLYIIVAESNEQFSRVLSSSLSKICALRSLHLYSGRTLDFLHFSSPAPPLLRCLTMDGYLSQFPNWISSLEHLTEFSMESTNLVADQVLESLSKLPKLQSIKLGCWSCRDRELAARTTHEFPALRILNLNLTPPFPEVVTFEQGSMTKLDTLLLEFSYMDTSIVGIDNLENLREVKLKGNKNNLMKYAVEQELENVREVLLEHAVEQNLVCVKEVLSKRAMELDLENLREFLTNREVELNLESLREEGAVEQILDNLRKAMLKGKENKSLECALKQLEDVNKDRREKINQIKVLVEYL